MKIAELSRQYQIALEYLRAVEDRVDLGMIDYAEAEFEQARRALNRAWLEHTTR